MMAGNKVKYEEWVSDMAELELQKIFRSIGQVRRSHYLLENVDVIEVGFRKFNQLCYARGTEVQRLFSKRQPEGSAVIKE